VLFDFDRLLVVGLFSIERCLELGGWDIAELAVESLSVVPLHPAEGREFEIGTSKCRHIGVGSRRRDDRRRRGARTGSAELRVDEIGVTRSIPLPS